MPSDNRVSIEVNAAQLAAISGAVADLGAALDGVTSNLSDEDVKRLPRIGDKTLAFDEKCRAYMADRPDLLPGFTNMAEVDRDRALVEALQPVLRQLAPMVSDLEKTILLAYSDIYKSDLAFYQSVKQAARRGVNGAAVIYEDLQQRFPGRPPRGNPPPPPDSE